MALDYNSKISDPVMNGRKINVGCGERYSIDWLNFDFSARPPHVVACDLLKHGIPVESNFADVVYSSHVLEHFSLRDGRDLLIECHRVLRPGGIVRVVVPDLETLSANYLSRLAEQRLTDGPLSADYTWAVLGLIDQLKRNSSGGDMIDFLKSHRAEELQQVFAQEGEEISALHSRLHKVDNTPASRTLRRQLLHLVQSARRLLRTSPLSGLYGDIVASTLPAHYKAALQIGRFRSTGEVHYWMYDDVSLSQLLRDLGFVDIARRSADESYIPGWSAEHLDSNPDGSVYKPMSLFVEARKAI